MIKDSTEQRSSTGLQKKNDDINGLIKLAMKLPIKLMLNTGSVICMKKVKKLEKPEASI